MSIALLMVPEGPDVYSLNHRIQGLQRSPMWIIANTFRSGWSEMKYCYRKL
jgi:hypothetical protein